MSIDRRTYLTLLCDVGCGNRLDTETENHIAARLEAGRKGWNYVQGVWFVPPEQTSEYHRRTGKRQTMRHVDVCPNCEVPEQGSQVSPAATP